MSCLTEYVKENKITTPIELEIKLVKITNKKSSTGNQDILELLLMEKM